MLNFEIIVKANKRLTISQETSSKSFATWTFKDVCEEYDHSVAPEPELDVLTLFSGIQSSPLETNFQMGTQDHLIKDIEAKMDVLEMIFDTELLRTLCKWNLRLTEKKHKREKHHVDEDEVPLSKHRTYGIVTDAEEWAFVEYTMHEDETVSFRMSWLDESLNSGGNWKDGAKNIISKIVWL
ncbi:hypothetical protein BGX30_012789 [Mortierella sp. GBA39]|nr:hypothetical protein BGX30_012789 [Mortierella sp. GBA39]